MKASLKNIVEGRAREIIRTHGADALKVARDQARLAREKGDHRGARQCALIVARILELKQDESAR